MVCKNAIGGVEPAGPKGIPVPTETAKTVTDAKVKLLANTKVNEDSKIVKPTVDTKLYASSPVRNPTIEFGKVSRDLLLNISEESKKSLAEYL